MLVKKLYSVDTLKNYNSSVLKEKMKASVLGRSYRDSIQKIKQINKEDPKINFSTPNDRDLVEVGSIERNLSDEKIRIPEIKFEIKRKNKTKNISRKNKMKLENTARVPSSIPSIYKIRDISNKHVRIDKPLLGRKEQ